MKKHSEYHLRQFVRCRAAGDEAGMAAAWDELVICEFDRMVGFVRGWRGGMQLSYYEKEDATSEAFERLWLRLRDSLEGSQMGEFVRAMYRCAEFACLDILAGAAKRSGREVHDDVEAEGRRTVWDDVAGEQLSRWDGEEEIRLQIEQLEGLIPLLPAEARLVIEHTRAGVPVEETMAALGVSRDTLYQRRRRALDALANLWSTDA